MKKFFIGLLIGLVGLGVYSCTETVPVEPEPEPITNPDLRVEDMNINIRNDGQLILSATVSNSGSASSAATTLYWYRSTDATISTQDTQVGTDVVTLLSAGGDTEESITISAPSSPGIYYYGACVDAVSGETSTANNCSSGYRVVITEDFNTLAAAGNTVPRGIWSDGTTMWVADTTDDKIYAYSLSNKARDASLDFNTLAAAGNNSPNGLWSDGTTMWVADFSGGFKINAYNLSTKARFTNEDFDTLLAAGNTFPRGIWSDGTTMWVSDSTDDKLYAYNLSTKARDTNQDFNTLAAAGNTFPNGLWSDGTTMWVSDSTDDKLYAYNLSTKARTASEDFNTLSNAGNNNSTDLWSDGTTMWVTDSTDGKLYAYNLATKQRQ